MEINCRHFSGYKPCGKATHCDDSCVQRDIPEIRILIVHLGALGAVLRSTHLIPAIKRKFSSSHLTWVTQAPADQLLQCIPEIDHVMTAGSLEVEILNQLEFDFCFVIDKSHAAIAISKKPRVKTTYGFTVDARSGAIVPNNSEAQELWKVGLSNELKFRVNRKTENQLIQEALNLGAYQSDFFPLRLNQSELLEVEKRKFDWQSNQHQPVIGINTGCSQIMPMKKMGFELTKKLIGQLLAAGYRNVVLLGGREDTARNVLLERETGCQNSPTENGLRDGLISVGACDILFSGDSLGMHMGISLSKFVIAWFGPTCPQEIELFGRGLKISTELSCTPCWKRSCSNALMCYDHVDLSRIMAGIEEGTVWWRKQNQGTQMTGNSESSSSKPHFSEISFSASRS